MGTGSKLPPRVRTCAFCKVAANITVAATVKNGFPIFKCRFKLLLQPQEEVSDFVVTVGVILFVPFLIIDVIIKERRLLFVTRLSGENSKDRSRGRSEAESPTSSVEAVTVDLKT